MKTDLFEKNLSGRMKREKNNLKSKREREKDERKRERKRCRIWFTSYTLNVNVSKLFGNGHKM